MQKVYTFPEVTNANIAIRAEQSPYSVQLMAMVYAIFSGNDFSAYCTPIALRFQNLIYFLLCLFVLSL